MVTAQSDTSNAAEPDEYEMTNFRIGVSALHRELVERNISLVELEEQSGVSINTFYAWQTGFRSPTLVHLCALAKSLGFEIILRRIRK